jgi:hypothetical protein
VERLEDEQQFPASVRESHHHPLTDGEAISGVGTWDDLGMVI